jgi:hypothetical protein
VHIGIVSRPNLKAVVEAAVTTLYADLGEKREHVFLIVTEGLERERIGRLLSLPTPLMDGLIRGRRDDEVYCTVSIRDEGAIWTVGAGRSDSSFEIVERLASTIQDAISESSLYRGEPWPACPIHHSHPMALRLRSTGVWWECPKDPRTATLVGSL